jgi:hypothetical protein
VADTLRLCPGSPSDVEVCTDGEAD